MLSRDPVAGLARIRAKVQGNALMAAASYTGAARSRRSMAGWSTSRGDADADTLRDLPTLRERSRDLVRNEPIAGAAINVTVGSVIGPGLTMRPQVDARFLGLSDDEADDLEDTIAREWPLWANSTDCDASRSQNFAGLQDLGFRSSLEAGDALAALVDPGRDARYRLAVQLIEGDRLSNPGWQADSETFAGGVERDSAGAPIRYHVLRQHPGSIHRGSKAATWDALPAFTPSGRRATLHLFRRLRIGQTRGVPYLAPVIELIRTLGDYRQHTVEAAAIQAMFTAFIRTPDGAGLGPYAPAPGGSSASKDGEFRMGGGAILDLAAGEDVVFGDPSQPTTVFGAFVQAVSEEIGAALELPHEVLRMHFTASYSASRAALLQAWMFFRTRRAWMAASFCQPIYEAWLDEAVATGRIRAPGYFADEAIRAAYARAVWVGPAMPEIDQVKAVEAAKGAEDRSYKTAVQVTAELDGGDWEANVRQAGKEKRMRQRYGLTIEGIASGDGPGPGQQQQQNQDLPDAA